MYTRPMIRYRLLVVMIMELLICMMHATNDAKPPPLGENIRATRIRCVLKYATDWMRLNSCVRSRVCERNRRKYATDCLLANVLKKAYTRTPQNQLRFKIVNNLHCISPRRKAQVDMFNLAYSTPGSQSTTTNFSLLHFPSAFTLSRLPSASFFFVHL